MAQSRSTAAGPAKVGFGERFTDHMVTLTWSADGGWADRPEVLPYGDLSFNPAMAGLHYGQVVFEGLKAHRQRDGALGTFRPDAHARRFQQSARRLAMPELPEGLFLEAVDALVAADGGLLPADDPHLSLYLRPVLFATEPCLALRPAREYMFLLIAFVTGGFFSDQPDPVSVLISRDFSRAAPGGTGQAKCAGNYAGAFLAQQAAAEAGCQQVVWLDPVERCWIEEMGGMNLFFVRGSGPSAEVVTPPLTGTLLPGVTRDSLLTLMAENGHAVREERVSVEQWRAQSDAGVITETFACGTAALVTPVGEVRDGQEGWVIGGGKPGRVTMAVREALTALHHDHTRDTHGWVRRHGTSPRRPTFVAHYPMYPNRQKEGKAHMVLLSHDMAGTGDTVVLLHSSACDRRMWDPQWQTLLDAGYRVVRCDFRGYGETPVPDRPNNDADDVRELLDALGIERAAVVGSSYGGRVALEFAARWPGRVSALALLSAGSPHHEPTEELDAFDAEEEALVDADDLDGAVELNVRTWLGPEADDEVREKVRTMQRRAYEVQLAAEEEFDQLEADCELSAIEARTLIVAGKNDLDYFQQVATDLADRLADARLVQLPWGGHLPSLERPDETAALLKDFLDASS
ncbi:branched-chain amino acid aminotransferase [Streptomyces atratus]|uniref:Branched-chain-amino-acid aminotransferase n=1 Tax=Streptomyces atratus TaxID=1893 RepID=A0A1K2EYM8_STRAR|nr:branched-chain amino acid aminotransferase [Streptomyces atratus]SFY40048.1 branched-chain amino acid aminotransferase, group II [Streptomyces atratus]